MQKKIVKSGMLFFVIFGCFISANVSFAEMKSSTSAVESGKSIAKTFCARCHAVEPNARSSHKSAPPFQTLSRKWPLNYLEESLAEGITVGHPDMPEFKFEPEQISSLLTYLQWLSESADSRETPNPEPRK